MTDCRVDSIKADFPTNIISFQMLLVESPTFDELWLENVTPVIKPPWSHSRCPVLGVKRGVLRDPHCM